MRKIIDVFILVLDLGNEEDEAVEETVQELPERSPLHPEALNFADLKRGLLLQRVNAYGRMNPTEAVVVDEPFVHREVPFYEGGAPWDSWKVRVATTDWRGKLVLEEWFLADMGVVPYELQDGTPFEWNEQNYTIAV